MIFVLLVFLECLALSNMLEFDAKFPFVSIMTHAKEDKKFHCLGAVVSSSFLMTTCKCVGKHVVTSPSYYEYKLYDPKDYVVNNGNTEFAIERFELNSHCRPSKYLDEIYVHDLGGLKIKDEFDKLPIEHISSPPGDHFTDTALNEMKREHIPCSIYYLESKEKVKPIIMKLTDNFKCAKLFCGATKESECTDLMSAILSEGVECSEFSDSKLESSNNLGIASPIICDDKLWGFASSIHGKYVLWSRIDLEPNRNFYEKLRLSSHSPHNPSNFISAQTLILYLIAKIVTH